MAEIKHLQKSEINQVGILVYKWDLYETFPNKVNHDIVYEQESAYG